MASFSLVDLFEVDLLVASLLIQRSYAPRFIAETSSGNLSRELKESRTAT
jgi:hypothetical protein